jgi:vacuolar-type H+-ATPase subunit E/Vma4
MGESELKTALQQEGEARIRSFWQEAEAAVEKRRGEIEEALEQLRQAVDQALQGELASLRSNLLFAAQTRATDCRLQAEAVVASRLSRMAREILPDLVGASRAELWDGLRNELPVSEWTHITVHPEDRELARQDFPAAVIACDESLCAGLVATTAEGAIRIDNSLPCRLTRAWPDLLPDLMKYLRERVDNDATAGHQTTC